METFTIRDLRERTGELVRGAEAGQLSLVTKHGDDAIGHLQLCCPRSSAGSLRKLGLKGSG